MTRTYIDPLKRAVECSAVQAESETGHTAQLVATLWLRLDGLTPSRPLVRISDFVAGQTSDALAFRGQ